MKNEIFFTLLMFSSLELAMAVSNVTSIAIAPGTCQGFPGYSPHPVGDLTQQFFFEARDTSNSSVDGLRLGFSASASNSSELVLNTDPTAPFNVFSCTNGTLFDVHGGPSLAFSPNEQNQVVGYFNTTGSKGPALNPEVFVHEMAGVEQEGLFLGLGNVTMWGFMHILDGDNGTYEVRLLGSKTSWRAGELNGFVRIVAL